MRHTRIKKRLYTKNKIKCMPAWSQGAVHNQDRTAQITSQRQASRSSNLDARSYRERQC